MVTVARAGSAADAAGRVPTAFQGHWQRNQIDGTTIAITPTTTHEPGYGYDIKVKQVRDPASVLPIYQREGRDNQRRACGPHATKSEQMLNQNRRSIGAKGWIKPNSN
jgi:hypothetical protein